MFKKYKKIIILGIVLIALVIFGLILGKSLTSQPEVQSTENPSAEFIDENGEPQKIEFMGAPEVSPDDPEGTEAFLGFIEGMDTGCFADAECFVVVDGKKIITMTGGLRRDEPLGEVKGVESFAEVFNYIGAFVEVKAMKLENGDYTLYGSEDYYIKMI